MIDHIYVPESFNHLRNQRIALRLQWVKARWNVFNVTCLFLQCQQYTTAEAPPPTFCPVHRSGRFLPEPEGDLRADKQKSGEKTRWDANVVQSGLKPDSSMYSGGVGVWGGGGGGVTALAELLKWQYRFFFLTKILQMSEGWAEEPNRLELSRMMLGP